MATAIIIDELKRFGPCHSASAPPSLAQARHYCRQLARLHYENFTVASGLLPRELRPHFFAIYAWCRWADDLADETDNRADSRELLAWWEQGLHDCYAGRAEHPVYIALFETVRRFEIPTEPFTDLLTAFRQDQVVNRYGCFDDLLQYCRFSANPVGRLVLYLGRSHQPELVALSDSICTGLQLANFWQDVANDYDRGRIYLPLEDCRGAGYDAAMFAQRRCNTAFRNLMRHQVDRAESYLRAGEPLVRQVPRALQLDIALFIQGGLGILRRIRACDYNVWDSRPRLGRWDRVRIAAESVSMVRRARRGPQS